MDRNVITHTKENLEDSKQGGMNQDKIHLINKIFNNETIRTVWDKEKEKYYISVVDIVRVLSESSNPQTHWRVMKKKT